MTGEEDREGKLREEARKGRPERKAMRRPLFNVMAAIAAAIWIAVLFLPRNYIDYEPFRGRQVRLTGTVCGLEPGLEREDSTTIGSMWQEKSGSVSEGDNSPDAGKSTVWKMLLTDVVIEKGAVSEDAESASGTAFLMEGPLEKETRVLCVLDSEPHVDMSARVRVRGSLSPFRIARNEGAFDLRQYYHILRIEFSLRDAAITAASPPLDRLDASLYRLKRHLSGSIDDVFSKENAPVLRAMLLGEKGLLEEETKELYQGAGIVHILSISGMHMSLIGMGIFAILGKIPIPVPTGIADYRKRKTMHEADVPARIRAAIRESQVEDMSSSLDRGRLKTEKRYIFKLKKIPLPVRAAVSFTVIFLYGKMVGMGTSVFRALIMLSLYILAKVIGRTYDLLTAAGIACVLLLLDQPLYVLHSGFLFSFAAVLSIGVLIPALPGKVLKGFAVPLGTLPVYLWMNGTFPVFSLLLNLIIIPLMGPVMASAGAAVVAGWLFPASLVNPAAGLIGLPAELILNLYRFLAEWTGKLPFHEIVPGRPAPAQIVLYYAMLLGLAAVSIYLKMPRIKRQVERWAERSELPTTSLQKGHKLQAPFLQNEQKLSSPSFQNKQKLPEPFPGSKNNLSATIQRNGNKLPTPSLQKGHKFQASFLRKENKLSAKASRETFMQENEEKGKFVCFLQALGEKVTVAAGKLCIAARARDNRQRRRLACLIASIWLTLSVFFLLIRIRPAFEMDFLYVGQGDGIFIRSGERTFMIDGGSSTEKELAKYTLLPFFHCRGVKCLDGVILTHDDIDHCSGLLELLESAAEGKQKIEISSIYLPEIAESMKGGHYLRIEELAEDYGIPVQYISRGLRIRSGNLTLTCLHPEKRAAYEDANAASTTILLSQGNFSALLTGDIEGEGEADLLKYLEEDGGAELLKNPKEERKADLPEYPEEKGEAGLREYPEEKGEAGLPEYPEEEGEAGLRDYSEEEREAGLQEYPDEEGAPKEEPILQVSVLKIAHHGSKNATSETFLKKIHMEQAVISAGLNNMYGHPSDELLDRLESSVSRPDIYRTDLQGEITIWVRKKGGDFQVKTFLGAE